MREFAMDVAREFGQFCWRTMYASVSAKAVMEWEAYFSKHGFRRQNDDLRHGIACALLHDVTLMSHGFEIQTPASPGDFIPHTVRSGITPDTESTDEEIMAAALAAGGTRFECTDS